MINKNRIGLGIISIVLLFLFSVGVNAVLPCDPPFAPIDVTATALSHHQILVTWVQVGSANGFRVYRNGISIDVGSSSLVDDGLVEGTSYTYSVQAYNYCGGFSLYSASASATTLFAKKTFSGFWNAKTKGNGNIYVNPNDIVTEEHTGSWNYYRDENRNWENGAYGPAIISHDTAENDVCDIIFYSNAPPIYSLPHSFEFEGKVDCNYGECVVSNILGEDDYGCDTSGFTEWALARGWSGGYYGLTGKTYNYDTRTLDGGLPALYAEGLYGVGQSTASGKAYSECDQHCRLPANIGNYDVCFNNCYAVNYTNYWDNFPETLLSCSGQKTKESMTSYGFREIIFDPSTGEMGVDDDSIRIGTVECLGNKPFCSTDPATNGMCVSQCLDADGDGYDICDSGPGSASGDDGRPKDCKDDDPNINPGAYELNDGIDNTCGGGRCVSNGASCNAPGAGSAIFAPSPDCFGLTCSDGEVNGLCQVVDENFVDLDDKDKDGISVCHGDCKDDVGGTSSDGFSCSNPPLDCGIDSNSNGIPDYSTCSYCINPNRGDIYDGEDNNCGRGLCAANRGISCTADANCTGLKCVNGQANGVCQIIDENTILDDLDFDGTSVCIGGDCFDSANGVSNDKDSSGLHFVCPTVTPAEILGTKHKFEEYCSNSATSKLCTQPCFGRGCGTPWPQPNCEIDSNNNGLMDLAGCAFCTKPNGKEVVDNVDNNCKGTCQASLGNKFVKVSSDGRAGGYGSVVGVIKANGNSYLQLCVDETREGGNPNSWGAMATYTFHPSNPGILPIPSVTSVTIPAVVMPVNQSINTERCSSLYSYTNAYGNWTVDLTITQNSGTVNTNGELVKVGTEFKDTPFSCKLMNSYTGDGDFSNQCVDEIGKPLKSPFGGIDQFCQMVDA